MADVRSSNEAQVRGTRDHDGVIGSFDSPLLAGARANESDPAAVADGDATHLWADRLGRLVVIPGHPPSARAGDTDGPKTVTVTGTTNTALLAAPGAGQSLVVTDLFCSNTSATKTRIDLVEGGTDGGSDGTVVISAALAADGGGFLWPKNRPYKLPANTALKARLGTGVSDVRVNLNYYVTP